MQTESVLVVTEAKAVPRVVRKVRAAVVSGKCLTCHRKAKRRGACDLCYSRYYLQAIRMTPTKRAAYEARLIRCGELLPAQAVRSIRRDDTFAKRASDLR
jgi:hypothetical protein